MAADNRSLARFELTGIPPAPRGVPKIQVTFRIDANGIVSVEAKDLGHRQGAEHQGQARRAACRRTTVDRLVTDAERFKYADELRRELAEVRNQAETLLYTTEAALEGYANLVEAKMLEDAQSLAGELRELLETQADLAQIRESYQKLEAVTFAIAEKMYGGVGGSDEGPPAET